MSRFDLCALSPDLHSLGLGLRLAVALVRGFEHAVDGPDLGLGWLDSVTLASRTVDAGAVVFPVRVLGRNHDVLAGFQIPWKTRR